MLLYKAVCRRLFRSPICSYNPIIRCVYLRILNSSCKVWDIVGRGERLTATEHQLPVKDAEDYQFLNVRVFFLVFFFYKDYNLNKLIDLKFNASKQQNILERVDFLHDFKSEAEIYICVSKSIHAYKSANRLY